jgi:hypothetical protein
VQQGSSTAGEGGGEGVCQRGMWVPLAVLLYQQTQCACSLFSIVATGSARIVTSRFELLETILARVGVGGAKGWS